MEPIPVSTPFLDDTERQEVKMALEENAISGLFGKHLTEFESRFAHYCDCQFGVTTTNGTTALHLALASLGIGEGDEVLVSTLTNMATFFAVLYLGAKPIPIDIEPDTYNLDPNLLEDKITKRTKAILVVHLYGHPVDMDPVMSIAKKYDLRVIEDCAQAHGATYKGAKVGSIGDIGCFSFYSNKIITTGEGGMLTTNHPEIAKKACSLKSLAFGDENKFMHKSLGYNFRMTNVQAAIGCGQLTKIEKIITKKRALARFYSQSLATTPYVQLPVEKPYARNVYWMYFIILTGPLKTLRKEIMESLSQQGIETREGFIPYNLQTQLFTEGQVDREACPVANDIAWSSFYLPSSPSLTENELDRVASTLKETLSQSLLSV